jgi:hypothetical protein
MLFYPQGNERRRKVMANSRQAMDAGMAGGAESNEPFERMLSGAAVMHMDPPGIRMRGSATSAKPPIPEKNRLAITTKTKYRIPETFLAESAEVGSSRLGGTAGTKEVALGGHEEIIPDKHYYR